MICAWQEFVKLLPLSLRQQVDKDYSNRLQELRGGRNRKKDQKLIGVIGCMAERMGEELVRDYGVDFVAGPDAYMDIPNLLAQCQQGLPAVNIQLSTTETYREVMPARIGKQISGFVSIMRGCNNFCSYCVVPYTRGRERSRDVESIKNEVLDLQQKGYKEVTLLGQNVNSYRYEQTNEQGESEIIDVTVKRYAVVFDNVPGQSQQFDFSAEGFGKYNAYHAQVANCGSQVLAPEEPTLEGYIFKGWEAWDSNNANDAYLHIPSVSDSYLGFSAVWEALPTPPNYTVSFEDYDGTPLKSESVEQGENATPPSAPARAAHHFTGWDKSYTTVTENRTLVAQYGEDEVTWTVTYKNWDNSDLGTETVNDGEAAQGVIATREGYTLTGWVDNTTGDPVDLTHVTADITVKATFELNVYTITYTLDDAPVQTEQVNHGDMPTAYQAIEAQGKPATEQYVYTFDHWDPAIVAATQDASYAAIFAQTLRQYVVTFQNWDHSPLKEEQVAYGHAATAPATPNRNVDYEFTGWDNDFSDVRTNLVVTAQFKMTDKDAVGTGIEDIRLDGSIAQKVLLDGTLYIIMPEGKVFNAQGTRVK